MAIKVGTFEKIYGSMPIGVQNLMISAYGFIQNKSRFGKEYYDRINFEKKFEKFTLEEKQNYQLKQLKELAQYAYDNSAFYKSFYKGIDIASFNSLDDIKKLPILTKEQLRTNIEDIMTVPAKGSVHSHTGGTTGKSLSVRFTINDFMIRQAVLAEFKEKAGFINNKMKRASFTGRQLVSPKQQKKVFWRYNKACKQMLYSSFDLSPDNLRYYVDSLNSFKPCALDGFFSSMCTIADYIEKNKIKLTFKPIAIFPTSETITPAGREKLERVFGCKVYNQYASSEGAPFVTECKCGKLHMEMSTGIIENYEDTDEILVTSFQSHATPLIRYRIGDSMAVSNTTKCACGISSVIFDSINGRNTDYLLNSKGAKISVANLSNIVKIVESTVNETQFVQLKADEIEMHIVTDGKKLSASDEQKLREGFFARFGDGTKLKIVYLDSIPREKSGKFRLIKNQII